MIKSNKLNLKKLLFLEIFWGATGRKQTFFSKKIPAPWISNIQFLKFIVSMLLDLSNLLIAKFSSLDLSFQNCDKKPKTSF